MNENETMKKNYFPFFFILCTFITYLTHMQALTHKLMLQLIKEPNFAGTQLE
jgi:hypothetical protein